jgi:hypothetical protein
MPSGHVPGHERSAGQEHNLGYLVRGLCPEALAASTQAFERDPRPEGRLCTAELSKLMPIG